MKIKSTYYPLCIDKWKSNNEDELMNKMYMKLTYSSNKIENNETHLRDVRSIFESRDVEGFTGDVKTLIEIRNHKKLYRMFHNLINVEHKRISVELIKRFHSILMEGCMSDRLLDKGERNGEFKKGDYVVGLNDVGAAPDDVLENLESLIDEIYEVEITESNILKVASYFHCWFESIHPFADGNGRVGRVLLNYLLMSNNCPPIVISDEDKTIYYEALEVFNDSQDIDLMFSFLDEQSYKTWLRDYNTRVKKLSSFIK